MIAVAVKELKNKLSAYLRQVAQGEVVLVTDRGRVVAEIRQASAERFEGPPGLQAIQRLHDEGLVEMGLPQDKTAYRLPTTAVEIDTQALLDAERGET